MMIDQSKRAWIGCLVAGIMLACAGPVLAQTDSGAGAWSGSGTTRRTVNLKSIQVLFSSTSSFTFKVDAWGHVSGNATVIYKLELDDANLRKLIAEVNSTANSMLGSLPFGLLGFKNAAELNQVGKVMSRGVAVVDIVGMSSSYNELMPVRSGRIQGQLTDGNLHLEWAERPAPLPYSTRRMMTMGSIVISQNDGPAYGQWSVNAKVFSMNAGQMQAAVEDANVNSVKGAERKSVFWSAVLISRP